MAAPHVFIVWTIQDAKGRKSVTKVNMPIAADLAIAQTFARSTAVLIDTIIRGQIVDIGIGLAVDFSSILGDIKAAPLPTADVEEGARFQWRTAVNAVTGFRLPTFDEDFILDGTREVDLADTDVDAFVDRITAGQTVGLINVSPSDDRGSDITALESARESFTSSRSG